MVRFGGPVIFSVSDGTMSGDWRDIIRYES